MPTAKTLKVRIATAFILLIGGCLLLLSCATMNMNAAGNPAGKETKSDVEVASLPASAKAEDPSHEVKAFSPEEKPVKEDIPLNNAVPAAKEVDIEEKDKSIDRKESLNMGKPVAETDLSPRDDTQDPSFSNEDRVFQVEPDSKEDEKERDIMEEALVLLDESHNHWTKGEMDDALHMLDQAYALLLDTDGNPEIARQKDDLRLIIAKRILAIFNSIQSPAKGMRGEIPLISNADVEKEIHSFQTLERDFFISAYQRSTIYRPVISNELKKAGLPDELSWLPLVESGFKVNALSRARALGLWQFIPSTGYKYGLNRDYWIDERMNIEKSTKAAISYLKDLHAMFGDWLTVLAGYNCGEGRVMQTISSQHINYLDRFWDLYQRLPHETARYVPRFLATLFIVKNPEKYGFDLIQEQHKYVLSDYEIVETSRSMRLHDIAVKLETSEEILGLLNAELRHKTTPDKTYRLKVPQGKGERLLQVVAEIPSAKIPRASYKTVPGAFIKHKVRRGETLGSIARKYNISTNTICSANNLSKRRLLYVGQRLKIPLRKENVSASSDYETPIKKASFYKVKKGDTLSSISRRCGLSVSELKKINNLKSDAVRIGQVIRMITTGRPDETTVKYKVQKGDNLAIIARKKGISLQRLLTLNKMSLGDTIYPGQEIIIQ